MQDLRQLGCAAQHSLTIDGRPGNWMQYCDLIWNGGVNLIAMKLFAPGSRGNAFAPGMGSLAIYVAVSSRPGDRLTIDNRPFSVDTDGRVTAGSLAGSTAGAFYRDPSTGKMTALEGTFTVRRFEHQTSPLEFGVELDLEGLTYAEGGQRRHMAGRMSMKAPAALKVAWRATTAQCMLQSTATHIMADQSSPARFTGCLAVQQSLDGRADGTLTLFLLRAGSQGYEHMPGPGWLVLSFPTGSSRSNVTFSVDADLSALTHLPAALPENGTNAVAVFHDLEQKRVPMTGTVIVQSLSTSPSGEFAVTADLSGLRAGTATFGGSLNARGTGVPPENTSGRLRYRGEEVCEPLLAKAGPWKCPATLRDRGEPPPFPPTLPCQRDTYVAAAVQYCWAAHCYAVLHVTAETVARGMASMTPDQAADKALQSLANADALCGSGPAFEGGRQCSTLHICGCPKCVP